MKIKKIKIRNPGARAVLMMNRTPGKGASFSGRAGAHAHGKKYKRREKHSRRVLIAEDC